VLEAIGRSDEYYLFEYVAARGYECIVIHSEGVSRVHATLERRDGAWWVCDQGSTQGVVLEGQPVSEARLRADQVFTLYKTTFRFSVAATARQ
jgi:pSer/pThr/pTyr-binding forkhead associated (FHA) protein